MLIADSEEVFYPEEIEKLKEDVEKKGLGLIVFAEWYNVKTAQHYKFFDDNTRTWWVPYAGGGNIPGLNALLEGYGIAFGDAVLKGRFMLGHDFALKYASGTNIVQFPAGGFLHGADLENIASKDRGMDRFFTTGLAESGEGRIAVYGDTSCLDSSFSQERCDDLLTAMLEYVNHKTPGRLLNYLMSEESKLASSLRPDDPLPQPMPNVNFSDVSFVLTHPLQCYKNSPLWDNPPPKDLPKKEEPVPDAQEVKDESSKSESGDGGRIVTEIVKDESHAAPDEIHSEPTLVVQSEHK